jgi:EAL domain-containing protein (putative c-di-GMP-specific phosphodiesterase class I)/FixJ family two-component response regulator
MSSIEPGVRSAFVLDDEPQIGTFVCKVLGMIGIAARQFADPIHFFTALKLTEPELLVLDLALGQSDAVEIIRQLEVLKFKGKVLLMSGHDQGTLEEIEQIGRSHGLAMLPPLRKPFRAADIKRVLQTSPAPAAQAACADEAPSQPEDPPANLKVDLKEVLQNRWLELWYQPKIDLKTLSVCGAEALLRGHHPVHGPLAPRQLLPPAGDPLYWPLSQFVISSAMADWALFAERGLPSRLAVNIPASVLNAPGFVNLVRKLLPTDPRFPGLIIEVTEDEIIRDPEWIKEVAAQLKLYSVRFSIDDFGSAYASLSRVTELPFIELKLDAPFVANCAANPLKWGVCQTVIDLAHRMRATVCAEGVETAEDLRCLMSLGCDTAQGFFFARPMPKQRFVETMLGQRAGVPLHSAALASPAPAARKA